MAKEEVILRWTERAAEQLEMLYEYVADENAAAADALIDRIVEAVENLIRFPLLGRTGRVPETRELVLAGTQIILAYRMHRDTVEILTVVHGARRWPDAF